MKLRRPFLLALLVLTPVLGYLAIHFMTRHRAATPVVRRLDPPKGQIVWADGGSPAVVGALDEPLDSPKREWAGRFHVNDRSLTWEYLQDSNQFSGHFLFRFTGANQRVRDRIVRNGEYGVLFEEGRDRIEYRRNDPSPSTRRFIPVPSDHPAF